MELKKLTLDNIAGGALPELFQRELERVLDNIDDVNCDPEKARTITITLTFLSNDQRSAAAVGAVCRASLVPVRKTASVVHLGRAGGLLQAFAADPNQMNLDLGDKVTPMSAAKEG